MPHSGLRCVSCRRDADVGPRRMSEQGAELRLTKSRHGRPCAGQPRRPDGSALENWPAHAFFSIWNAAPVGVGGRHKAGQDGLKTTDMAFAGLLTRVLCPDRLSSRPSRPSQVCLGLRFEAALILLGKSQINRGFRHARLLRTAPSLVTPASASRRRVPVRPRGPEPRSATPDRPASDKPCRCRAGP